MPTVTPQDLPIRPVNKPILCSPYEEPTEHWGYDTRSGEAAVKGIKPPGSEVLAVHRLDGKVRY